jgi:hypothetical protein
MPVFLSEVAALPPARLQQKSQVDCHALERNRAIARCDSPIAKYSTKYYTLNRRVFKTRPFARWLRKSRLSDVVLCGAVAEMAAGLIDGDLGGHVFKKRVASPGRGKRGSARVLVGTNRAHRWFFMYGFEKNERANIGECELAALQRLAESLLKLEASQLSIALKHAELTEICHEEDPHTG